MKHEHHGRDAGDDDQLTRDVPEQICGFGLEDLRIARDAVHQLTGSMPLEEWQRLRVDVGEEPAAKMIRAMHSQERRRPQEKDVRDVQYAQNAKRRGQPSVQIDMMALLEDGVDRLL